VSLTLISERDIPAEFQSANMYAAADFQARVQRFKDWCLSNLVFYYARPRESFSSEEARRLANEAGCTRLLMEDMS
jgi:hypothetical protein